MTTTDTATRIQPSIKTGQHTTQESAADFFVFSHAGRDYRCFRRKGQGNYCIRVTHKIHNPHGSVKGLGTHIPRIARANAVSYIEALHSGRWDDLERMRLRNPYATVGEIERIYRAHAEDALHLDPQTVIKNCSALLSLVRTTVAGAPADVRTDRLTDGFVLEFVAAARAAGRSESGIRSSLIQARSVFQPAALRLYKHLKLPDISGFRKPVKLDPSDEAFVPIPHDVVAAMSEAATALRIADPALWLTYVLMSRIGMRNEEVQYARWAWIEKRPEGPTMVIRDRAEESFSVKNALPRAIVIPPDLWEMMCEHASDGHIISATTTTGRFDITHRAINRFVRQFLPDRQKGAYELRKWAGSVILTSSRNLLLTQYFLGHKSYSTTEKYYAKYLQTITAVSSNDLQAVYAPAAVTTPPADPTDAPTATQASPTTPAGG